MQWSKENPWDPNTVLDGDDPQHVAWVHEKAQERAMKYGIANVTYRLTQGVLKNIIPAVASTNATIAAACATEVIMTIYIYLYIFVLLKIETCIIFIKKKCIV